nr:coiled-coil domain-containing protein 17 isoform X3 [Anser cygnoides]
MAEEPLGAKLWRWQLKSQPAGDGCRAKHGKAGCEARHFKGVGKGLKPAKTEGAEADGLLTAGSGSCWPCQPCTTALTASLGRACPAPQHLPSHLGNQTPPQPAATSPRAGCPMPGAGAFTCPSCRMAFSSRPLLRAHQERLCVGTPRDSSSHGPRGDPGRARRLQDPSIGMSQNGDHAEQHHLLLLSGLPPAMLGPRGPRRAQGAPLGDILTPRERALLRATEPGGHSTQQPAASGLTKQGEPSQRPALPQGHLRAPELLEAHKQHVAEIRARTQQLEQQRAGLCRRLAVLADEQLRPKPRRSPEALRGEAGHPHGGTALHLSALLPPAGPLAAEARALMLSYLRSGGHDAAILAQLLDLQVEATALEERAARRTERPRAGTQDLDAVLLAVELENQRLEDELLALKVRKARRADASSLAAQQHAEDLAQLQAEVGMLRRQAEGTGPRVIPPVLPRPQLPPARSLPGFVMESPGPALGPGSPPAPSRLPAAPSLPGIPIAALEDPPPAREPPAEHEPPRRHIPSHF